MGKRGVVVRLPDYQKETSMKAREFSAMKCIAPETLSEGAENEIP